MAKIKEKLHKECIVKSVRVRSRVHIYSFIFSDVLPKVRLIVNHCGARGGLHNYFVIRRELLVMKLHKAVILCAKRGLKLKDIRQQDVTHGRAALIRLFFFLSPSFLPSFFFLLPSR